MHLGEQQQWYESFNNTISFRNCRLIDVYNIENIPTEALGAVQQILSQVPLCLVDSASSLSCLVMKTRTDRFG
jgi:hypothetical protein